ncbi:Vacuolar protein-sorting-associated protein 25 [Microtus ochrogaster]|uniref:Vacuolar protein-sorting-associated protein 25 n=1 Tax=Microtus ochrogaster TaxID=79684 RepID=A0A8J6GK66_MICOH|nr:Vacuolar protein-sorting-associated protein 25 [Microtus ochrogaster]
MAMSFEWPRQYRFPPFTRQEQLALRKQSSMTVSPLLNNVKLQRKLRLDKNKSSFPIMWQRPEEWGKFIYQWVSRSCQNNSVFTL